MTGTGRDCATELKEFYDVDVVVIPTHRPMIRADHTDLVFTHREAKERAVVDEIGRAHASGRPVLVGTSTVTESERIAGRLRVAGVACQVLNAKSDAEEASIVARAGAFGAVTIATNMAGRGTDIRLGGANEEDSERVAGLGGLYVIGTNRHESRRVDLQLRGRAGRQGDPGESRFFVSLEDDLLVKYDIRGLIPAAQFPPASDTAVDNPVVLREVARAQRIVEGQNFEIRRTLSRYSRVLEEQHRILFDRRRAVLLGDEPLGVWLTRDPERHTSLVSAVGAPAVDRAERLVMLGCLDRAWRDHLAFCAELREGIHLVRLGGRDPLTHYTGEAIRAFETLDEGIDDEVAAAIENVRVTGGTIDLSATGLTLPSSTWTYLVNDDPFKDRIGTLLTGPGGTSVAIYAALYLGPLLVAWGLAERLFRRTARRRSDLVAPDRRSQELRTGV